MMDKEKVSQTMRITKEHADDEFSGRAVSGEAMKSKGNQSLVAFMETLKEIDDGYGICGKQCSCY